MPQPPLNQQTRQLEALIGVQLFVRSHPRVHLTPAGNVLLEQARDIQQRVDGAVALVQRTQRGESGQLRLGLTRATPLLPQFPRTIFTYR